MSDPEQTSPSGNKLRVAVKAGRTPLVAKILAVMTRKLRERGIALSEVETGGRAGKDADVILDCAAGIGPEGFAISRTASAGRPAWLITGNDERGLLYGVGKFLRGCRFGSDAGAAAAGWRYGGEEGAWRPKLVVRGMYFATHFHNFYHDAPLAEVARYVEDLALWGCNALSVWFDMHHYAGLQDPAAQAMIARLHAILKAANAVGMGAGLTTLANEAYHTSPAALRAEPFPHHYHVEICPSKPDGLSLILKWREEMLAAFADLTLDYIWIWPYDQGGCKCPECKPWGGNGFVRNAAAVGALARRLLPRTKVVISTWEFGYWEGDPEWERFYAALARKPEWADYIMAEGHGDFPPYILKHGPPAGYPLLNFPEISMFGMDPWGGYGANLQTRRLQKVWASCHSLLAGGFPYSEGIFEDINKAVCLQLYWDPGRKVEDIVCEYAGFEYSPAAAREVGQAVQQLEANMAHGLVPGEVLREWRQKIMAGLNPAQAACVLYKLDKVHAPEVPLALLNAAAQRMSDGARQAWRWRLLWLRAALDVELARSGGVPTDKSDEYFEEVCRISHAETAGWAPSRRILSQLMVSPEGRRYWEELRKQPGFGAVGKFDLIGLRQGMGARQEPADSRVKCVRAQIDGIPCEWVLAPGADPDLRLLYLHGGGWVSGSGANYLPLAAEISAASKCAVLLPDYRLAPEHPFPSGLEDCVRAHVWLVANGPNGPASARATFIAGDSAGGNLTLATLLALRDRRLSLPLGGIPISACSDFTMASESMRTEEDHIFSVRSMPVVREFYLGKADPRNPLASPVFGDFTGLPPLLIQAGEHEMLRDDSVRVAAKARADGVKVQLEIWPGMVHVFHVRGLPESREAIEHLADFMRECLRSSSRAANS